MKQEKILIIDAEWSYVELLRRKLEAKGFTVMQEPDFSRGIKRFREETPTIVLAHADVQGEVNDFLSEMRKSSDVPALLMKENPELLEKITALEIGADDYIPIPTDAEEIIARIRSILRRYNKSSLQKNIMEVIYPGIRVDLSRYELTLDGQNIKIPPKELNLLYLLSSNPNMVFSREQLMDRIWGFECYSDMRTVDVHIKRLREKLRGHEKGWSLVTVRGAGYKFSTK